MRVALATLVAALALALAAPAHAEDRLDRAAAGLRSSPLYVHPELDYLIPPSDRALILTHLRDAYLTFDVKVVVLPSVEADESGGEADRMLWALDDKLSRSGRLLIAVDQRGSFEIVQARLKRDLDVPFEIEYGTSGEDGPKTIVPRLRAVFQLAGEAEERDYVYQRDRPTDPLDPLPEDRPPYDELEDDDDDGSDWGILVGCLVAGMFVGLIGWGFSLVFRDFRRA